MSTTQWSSLSDNLLDASMVAFAVALVALAGEWAFGTRSSVARRVAQQQETVAAKSVRQPVGVTVGGGAVLSSPVEVPGDDAVAADRRSRATRFGNVGFSVTVLGTLLLVAGLASRGFAAGRAPWGNMYEYAITGATVAALVYLTIERKYHLRALGLWVVLALLLLVGLARTVLYIPAGPLVPALRSYWLLIHVSAATIAAGVFTVGAVTNGLYLVTQRKLTKGQPLGNLPEPAKLDQLSYRLTAFAFPIWTFAVVAGSIWAQASWGRYWNWDPKETWAFITWVVFAAYLHARTTAGWRGKKAAIIGLVGYTTLLFNFVGVNIFFSGLHSYGGLT